LIFPENGSHLAWNMWTSTTAGCWIPQSDNLSGNQTAVDSRTWSQGLDWLGVVTAEKRQPTSQ